MGGRKLILDSGCGTGNLTLKLLKREKKVVAFDNNAAGLKILKQKCSKFSKQLMIVKTNAMLFDNLALSNFDGVCSMLVLNFVSNPEKYLQNCYSVLKENGVLSLSVWLSSANWRTMVKPEILELKRKKVIKNHKEEFIVILPLLRKAIEVIKKRPFTKQKLMLLCKKVGFKEVVFIGATHQNTCALINAVK